MFIYKITRNTVIKSILVNQYPSVVLRYKGEDIYNFSIICPHDPLKLYLKKNLTHIEKFREYLENITDGYFNSNFELIDYDIPYEKGCRVGLILNKTKRSLQYYDEHTIMNIVVGGNHPKIRPEDIFIFVFEISEEVKTHFDLMKMMEV
jgi:hypothetical protein